MSLHAKERRMNTYHHSTLLMATIFLLMAGNAAANSTFVTDCEDKLGPGPLVDTADIENAHTYQMLVNEYAHLTSHPAGISDCQAVADYFIAKSQEYLNAASIDRKLVTVDLSDKSLESVEPISLLNQYTKINGSGVLDKVTVHDLELSHNLLEAEDFQTFYHMTKVVVLNLSHNQVRNIQFLDGTANFSLRKLYLSHNPLEELELTGSGQAPNLHYLDISHRVIPTLPPEATEPVLEIDTRNSFPNLASINMSHSGIISIQSSFSSQQLLNVNANEVVFDDSMTKLLMSEPLYVTARFSENVAKTLSSGMEGNLEDIIFLDLSDSDITDRHVGALFTKRGVRYFVMTGSDTTSLENLEFATTFPGFADWYADKIMSNATRTIGLAVDDTDVIGFLPEIVVYHDNSGALSELTRISSYDPGTEPFRGIKYLSADLMQPGFSVYPEDLASLERVTVGDAGHCPGAGAATCQVVVNNTTPYHHLFETGLNDVMYGFCQEILGQPCQDVTFDCSNEAWVLSSDDRELYQQLCP